MLKDSSWFWLAACRRKSSLDDAAAVDSGVGDRRFDTLDGRQAPAPERRSGSLHVGPSEPT
jgi:hypothetical protein